MLRGVPDGGAVLCGRIAVSKEVLQNRTLVFYSEELSEQDFNGTGAFLWKCL